MGRALTGWLGAGVAVVGRSHARAGLPCQDAVAVHRDPRLSAVALADGAGSAPRAEEGARLVAEAAVEAVGAHFGPLLVADTRVAAEILLAPVRARLEAAAKAEGRPVTDFASTLLLAAVKDEQYFALHVGDGLIASERNGRAAVLSAPERGEHINETVFVTSRGVLDHARVSRGPRGGFESFVLMSDGAAESLYDRRAGSPAPAVRTLARWLDSHGPAEVRAALENSVGDVLRRHTGDDCSVGILRRVTLSVENLPQVPQGLALALLDCKSRNGLRHRSDVLREVLRVPTTSLRALCVATGFHETTVRRHLAALWPLLTLP